MKATCPVVAFLNCEHTRWWWVHQPTRIIVVRRLKIRPNANLLHGMLIAPGKFPPQNPFQYLVRSPRLRSFTIISFMHNTSNSTMIVSIIIDGQNSCKHYGEKLRQIMGFLNYIAKRATGAACIFIGCPHLL